MAKSSLKKLSELGITHLTRSHYELLMLDFSFATNMTLYFDVVRGIGNNHCSKLSSHE